MKEVWSGTVTGSQNVVSHVLQMRERLASMTDLVKENMQEAQRKQKHWYGDKAQAREFKPGDEVLLLLPSSTNSVKAKWLGPYKVVQKMGPVDYEIEMGDKRKKRKIFHINLLKKFVRRVSEVLVCVGIKDVGGDEEGQDKDVTWTLDSSGEVEDYMDEGLSSEQKGELAGDLAEYKGVLKDRPGQTTQAEHDIDIGEGVRLRGSVLIVFPRPNKIRLRKRLKMMLELGVIE